MRVGAYDERVAAYGAVHAVHRTAAQGSGLEPSVGSAGYSRDVAVKPFLLIDVDGVLNPYACRECPEGFVEERILGFRVRLNRRHGERLNGLSEQFDLVWATTWEHNANTEIGRRLGLPDLPVITFRRGGSGYEWKVPDVAEFTIGRPVAWLDDDIGAVAEEWAERRNDPTLLLRVRPGVGLTDAHFDELVAWAASLTEGASERSRT